MKFFVLSYLFLTLITGALAQDFTLSSAIKKDQKNQIERDIDVLNNFLFIPNSNTPETLKVLDLETLSAQNARAWLEERVKYIIEESAFSKVKTLFRRASYVERENALYPEAQTKPFSLNNAETEIAPTEKETKIVMTNVSADLYVQGKKEERVYGININRGLIKRPIKIAINSPRAGVIQIGAGLFERDFTINNQDQNSIANSIWRLSVLFHEARHSDGHGESLAFIHAICPKGHDYAGLPACDESLNGAYAVGANMMIEMMKSCKEGCTLRDKEIMKLIIIDNKLRILPKTHRDTPPQSWDATPEEI